MRDFDTPVGTLSWATNMKEMEIDQDNASWLPTYQATCEISRNISSH